MENKSCSTTPLLGTGELETNRTKFNETDRQKTKSSNEFTEDLKFPKVLEALEETTDKVWCVKVIGPYIASALGKTIVLWDSEAMIEVNSLQRHEAQIKCLVNLDDCRLASGSSEGRIRVWDLESGEQVAMLEGDLSEVLCLESIGENYLVSNYENEIALWNIESEEMEDSIQGHSDLVTCMKKVNGLLATGSKDKTIRLWEIEDKSLKEVGVLEGHNAGVSCLGEFNGHLVSASEDKTVKVWDLDSKKEVTTLKEHGGSINCLGTVDKFLVSGSSDSKIRLWKLKKGKHDQVEIKEFAVLEEHTGSVNSLVSKNHNLISASSDGTVRIWEVSKKQESFTLGEHSSWIRSMAAIGDKQIASGCKDGTIKLWSVESRKGLGVLKGHTNEVYCLIEMDGKLVSGSKDKTIKIWNLTTKEVEKTLEGHSDFVYSLEKTEKYLISGSKDKTIKVWGRNDLEEKATLRGHKDSVFSIAVRGNYLISGSQDNTIRIWNLDSRKQVSAIQAHNKWVRSVTTVGDYIASGSADNTIKLWKYTGKHVATLRGHQNQVKVLATIGDFLISGSYDGTVRIWDVQQQKELGVIKEHSKEVECLAVSGDFLASGSDDQTVKLTKLSYDYRFLPGYDTAVYSFKKLAESEFSEYSPKINEILIMPQRINILHVLAHQGKYKMLKRALKEGCPFLESAAGETPLTIALDQGNKRCVEAILKYIGKVKDKRVQKVMVSKIGGDLASIVETDSVHLGPIFKAASMSFTDFEDTEQLPKYTKTKDPQVNLLEHSFKSTEASKKTEEVKIGYTRLQFKFSSGSKESLDLLNALESTESIECLSSEFVQALVGYKWSRFKVMFWILSILNLLSVVTITGIAFSEDIFAKQLFAWVFLANNLFFTIFELFQIVASAKYGYFKSSKNYLDLVRLPLGYTWAFISLQSNFENVNSTNLLTLVTSLLFWIEGVSAFKVFDSTRYYVWMILEVVKDTKGFLGILIYFAIAYCGMLGTTINSSFWDTFKVSYNLLLGDFDTGDLDNLQWAVFIIGSMLNLIVMLNLLISIISESFAKINSEKMASDTRIRLDLVIEVENCIFWRKKEGPQYLFFVEEYEGEEEEDSKLEKDVQAIKAEMESMKKDVAKILELLEK